MGKTFGREKYNGLLSGESYLREINQVPLLTPEEEFKLAARYRKYNDREAAEQLVTSNLRFVVKVAFLNQEESLALEQERKILKQGVFSAMKNLNGKEEYVIRNRIMSDSFLTLQEIGNHLNLSRERVRQIQSEALKKLRKEISPGLEPRA